MRGVKDHPYQHLLRWFRGKGKGKRTTDRKDLGNRQRPKAVSSEVKAE